MARPLSLDELLARGWTLEPSRGVNRPGHVSLALVLRTDGVRRAQLSGIAPCYDAAVKDVVAETNRWLRRNALVEETLLARRIAARRASGPVGRRSVYRGVGVHAKPIARTTRLSPGLTRRAA
jgi:hypothetical protein